MNYQPTHESVYDGSDAMLVSQDGGSITLINEDGFQWTDSQTDWKVIA